jgi:hypothetical protein
MYSFFSLLLCVKLFYHEKDFLYPFIVAAIITECTA